MACVQSVFEHLSCIISSIFAYREGPDDLLQHCLKVISLVKAGLSSVLQIPGLF